MDSFQATAAGGALQRQRDFSPMRELGPMQGYSTPTLPPSSSSTTLPVKLNGTYASDGSAAASYDLGLPSGSFGPPVGNLGSSMAAGYDGFRPASPMGRIGAPHDGLLLPGSAAAPAAAVGSNAAQLPRPQGPLQSPLPAALQPSSSLPGMANYTAGLAYGQVMGNSLSTHGGSYIAPSPSTAGPEQFSSLGTWSDLIAGGVVDKPYIEAEAERRKQEVERQMDNKLAELESRCVEQCASIKQQAEYHTQMAEKQIQSHKRHHLAHIARQAELQAYSILQRAEMEKGRLGQEACRALNQQSEREKAAVLQEAMRKAEDVWRHSQQALLEQANRAKADIDVQAMRRSEDIEREAREAVSRVYISPNGPLGVGVDSLSSFAPAPAPALT